MTRYTTEQLASFPWIVSTDTLRIDHLADAYLGAFDRLGQDVPEPFRSDLQQCAAYASDLTGPEPCDAWEIATAWAFDRLGELAPTGFYFGASEGDGACFGFWLQEEWAECLEHCGFAADSDPAALVPIISELCSSGVDPDTYEDCYQGEAEGYSSEQAGADYAQQLADELGLPPKLDGASWPMSCIDWQAAWRELELGDAYWLQRINGSQWAVFRPC
jgi:hypothetical protein